MSNFIADFQLNFIEDNRWRYITNGLGTTFSVTLFAAVFGVLLGFLVALVRSTVDKGGSKSVLLKILDFICKVYLTVIRGTPAMIQLLIMYYIIFASPDISKQFVAILSFGINSGVKVYLDGSLRRFDVVYPAAGTASSAAELTVSELELATSPEAWVDVTQIPSVNEE